MPDNPLCIKHGQEIEAVKSQLCSMEDKQDTTMLSVKKIENCLLGYFDSEGHAHPGQLEIIRNHQKEIKRTHGFFKWAIGFLSSVTIAVIVFLITSALPQKSEGHDGHNHTDLSPAQRTETAHPRN